MGKYSKSRASSRAKAQEQTYRRNSNSKRKSKKSNRTGVIVVICVAITAIVIALAAGYLYLRNAERNGVIVENVKLAGVDVGGMTQSQAMDAIRANAAAYNQTPMVVTVLDEKVELSPAYLGKLNIRKAVKAAYKYGNSGSQAKRDAERNIALNEGYIVDITPYLDIDQDAVKNALSTLATGYSSALTQTKYEVTGEAPNHKLVVTRGIPEYGLDLDNLYDQVLDAYNNFIFAVEGECGMIEPDPIDLEAILSNYYVAPQDAAFNPSTFEITEGKDGYGFDIDAANKKIQDTPYGSTVEIPFTAIPPKVTAKDLSSVLYRDELATYTAEHDSDPDRDVNLRLACEAINGKVLLPGDVFSYNEALGERTKAKGYRPGKSYSGNETVETIGGGICQVSSALYYCALVSDLEILARENHGFVTSYVPLGMDATVSWGSLDFRFKNTTDYPIRIDAVADGGNTTITLTGTDTKEYYVEMEYDVLNTYDYALSYETYSANNSQGLQDGDYITEPYVGYDVKTYRCKYDKDTKKLISRDFEEESNYRSRDGVICKIDGSSGSNAGKPGIGGGGVSDSPGALPD